MAREGFESREQGMSSALFGQACLFMASLFCVGHVLSRKFRPTLSHLILFWITTAFAILIWAHVTSDFSYFNVVQHSHTTKPLLYKISGVWGNHEGSMLLWVLILSLYNSLSSYFLSQNLREPVVRILTSVTLGFLAFVLIASDPFITLEIPLLEGDDLNPLLQDPSLAIHPPILYAGYAGCCVPFALCVVTLLENNLSSNHIQMLRLSMLIAWSFMTAGLALGSFWAYYELGWGGFWFWDPVENAALLPWLTATAFLHSIVCVQKQQTLIRASLLLGILTFGLCLFSLFFVRSGLLTSVHSFAVDPERGVLLLILLSVFISPALVLWMWRFSNFQSLVIPSPWSRSGMIVLNNVFLLCGAATILLSILYPLILSHFGQSITIGTPYFQTTFIPLMLSLLGLMGVGIWMGYEKRPLFSVFGKIQPALSSAILSVLFCWWVLPASSVLAFFATGLSVWLMVSSLLYLRSRPINFRFFSKPASPDPRNKSKDDKWWFRKKSIKNLSMVLAHFGLGLCVLGMVCSIYGEIEQHVFVKKGESFGIAGYQGTFKNLQIQDGPNYKAHQAVLELSQSGKIIAQLIPEKRYYETQKIIHNETAIYSTFFSHIYTALIDDSEGTIELKVHYKPFINFLWTGIILMIIGGVLGVIKCLSKMNIGLLAIFISTFSCANNIEESAHVLYKQIICPVCAGQTLEDSQSDQAILMKQEILKSLKDGKSEETILQDFMTIYGESIVRDPPLKLSTIPLWLVPWTLLFCAIFVILFRWKR